jgi:hypothetical protein
LSLQDAFTHFVAPMRRAFTIPSGMPQDEFLADLAEELSGFTSYQLETAAKHFRKSREMRSFPTIAECRSACQRFTEVPVIQIAGPKYKTEEERKAEAIQERHRLIDAYRMCRCDLGRQADHEGWLQTLVEFCAEHCRLPNRQEAAKLQAFSDEVDRNLHAEPKPANYLMLCQIRDHMREKARREVFEFQHREAAE